ncbi:hypothetical protein BDV95DRAFT_559703 [Massariosphaeria phaeospora]|uniref:Uncharacterized protein n=1 Tax=Massariosphaeria phaeospora TaxID=100035 RepID=A0A7C8MG43_9PLEO|nr:hypothetical protein BDV95DRAFT_559703 [Massariosphaeria phaeospora]
MLLLATLSSASYTVSNYIRWWGFMAAVSCGDILKTRLSKVSRVFSKERATNMIDYAIHYHRRDPGEGTHIHRKDPLRHVTSILTGDGKSPKLLRVGVY